jgi:hypothetical protein
MRSSRLDSMVLMLVAALPTNFNQSANIKSKFQPIKRVYGRAQGANGNALGGGLLYTHEEDGCVPYKSKLPFTPSMYYTESFPLETL